MIPRYPDEPLYGSRPWTEEREELEEQIADAEYEHRREALAEMDAKEACLQPQKEGHTDITIQSPNDTNHERN